MHSMWQPRKNRDQEPSNDVDDSTSQTLCSRRYISGSKAGVKDSKRIPEDGQGLLHQDCWQTIPKMENKAMAGGVLMSG